MKTYSIEELSIYFGVTQNTIIRWINKGRFIPMDNRKFESDIQIAENVLWLARTGKCYSISSVVDSWFEENKHILD